MRHIRSIRTRGVEGKILEFCTIAPHYKLRCKSNVFAGQYYVVETHTFGFISFSCFFKTEHDT